MRPSKINSTRPSAPATASHYETLAQAAAAMNVPKSVLSNARKQNAPGFRGPRVYPAELLPWLKEHQSELEGDGLTKEQLQCRKLRGECERIEFANAALEGEYVKASDVDSWLVPKAESLKRLLNSKIVNEMLPKLTGLQVPEMVPIAKAVITAIIVDFKKPMQMDKTNQ